MSCQFGVSLFYITKLVCASDLRLLVHYSAISTYLMYWDRMDQQLRVQALGIYEHKFIDSI